MDFKEFDAYMLKLLQQGRNNEDSKLKFYLDEQQPENSQETYANLSTQEKDQYIQQLIRRTDILLDDLISNPIIDTTQQRWRKVKENYKKNINGLSLIEQYLKHQFAYTVNKGEKVRLCLCDEEGELDIDLNMYVLLHEIVHIYDKRYLNTPEKHDDYFWILFAKIIQRAMQLNLLDRQIFNKDQRRCNTDILKKTDIIQIETFSLKQLPKVEI